jgi:hypothetical protein
MRSLNNNNRLRNLQLMVVLSMPITILGIMDITTTRMDSEVTEVVTTITEVAEVAITIP